MKSFKHFLRGSLYVLVILFLLVIIGGNIFCFLLDRFLKPLMVLSTDKKK